MDAPTIQPSISGALKDRMGYLIARQGVVSSNIANASTPGYLAKDLDFQAMVNRSTMGLATTNGSHLQGSRKGASSAAEISERHIRHDGNSVKVDEQMLKLSDIQINYRLMTQLYAKHGQMQKMALGSGAAGGR